MSCGVLEISDVLKELH